MHQLWNLAAILKLSSKIPPLTQTCQNFVTYFNFFVPCPNAREERKRETVGVRETEREGKREREREREAPPVKKAESKKEEI